MVIFPLAPDQTIAQMWSNGARGGIFFCLFLDTVYIHTHTYIHIHESEDTMLYHSEVINIKYNVNIIAKHLNIPFGYIWSG